MKKEAVAADVWLKDVAPSTQLRQWFSHQVERWEEFRRRYREELDANVLHNGAVVLRDYLVERQARRSRCGKREAEDDRRTDRRARRRAR